MPSAAFPLRWRKIGTSTAIPDRHPIGIGQLQVGLYVDPDLKWFEPPFAFSKFRIKSEEQIQTIRSLGLKTVCYDPALSDATLIWFRDFGPV